MLTNDFLEEAAAKMAKFHSIKFEVPGIPFKTHYDRVFDQMGQAFTGKLLQEIVMNSKEQFRTINSSMNAVMI